MNTRSYTKHLRIERPFMNPLAFFLICVYLALLIIRPQEYADILQGLPILAVVESFALLAWLADRKELNNSSTISLAALNVVILISLLFVSQAFALSQATEFFFAILLMFLLVSHSVDTYQRHLTIVKLIVFCVGILALHSIDQALDPQKMGWTGQTMSHRLDGGSSIWQSRYLGIFSDSNDLGMLFSASVPLAILTIANTHSNLSKGFYVAVLLAIFWAIVLTNSRGTFLAAMSVFATFFWYRYGTFKSMLLSLGMLPILFLLAPSRFANTLDESSMGRVDAWWAGLQMWKSYPIFGVGKAQYVEHHEKTAHNSWILALAELGTVGYMLWCGFLFTAMFFAYRIVSTPVAEFVNAGMPEKQAKIESMIAKASFSALAACCVSMMFLSRTYMQLMYLVAAFIIGQSFRIYAEHPTLTPGDNWGKVLAASVATGATIIIAMMTLL